MTRLLLRRLRIFLPTLVLVSILVFALRMIIPGGPAEALAGDNPTPATIASIKAQFGLNKPLINQYFEWIGGILHGDFGTSYQTGQPVSELLKPRFGTSIELVILGLIISVVLGGALGMFAAINRRTLAGRFVFGGSAIGLAVPVFWLSTICAGVFGAELGILPSGGWTPISAGLIPHLKSVLMPSVLIAFPTTALLARQVRSGMVNALDSPYVRTARAVGIGRARIYFELALRNAASPVVTFLPVAIAGLVGELVIVDNVFVLTGLGSAITNAVTARDFATLQAIALILAITVLVATLLADLGLAVLDPRRRREIR